MPVRGGPGTVPRMQYGFVLDQSRCIGCHACTVACKSENHVPVGKFRTWVKYTEEGAFPKVKRSFAVLRCNQCTDAPCVSICPTNALEKRGDGIVDIDPKSCIGCKSCMHGCPYDAIYLNEDSGTAEKCHFCAHRTEQGLAPACAVVCPTEAIIPGDFHDPESVVSRMKREFDLDVRKPEAGTGPNVMYRDVAAAGIDPMLTSSAGGHLWADRHPGLDQRMLDYEASDATAKTTYDVAHPALWGWKITGYLLTKSLAAGFFLAPWLAALVAGEGSGVSSATALAALVFLTATSLLLVLDLKRPERFFYILTRPNFSSWLVRGTYFLIAFGGLLTVQLVLAWFAVDVPETLRLPLDLLTAVAAALSACYTGWLFGQAKGRVLWMRTNLWLHLIVQAVVAGAAGALLLGVAGLDVPGSERLGLVLLVALVLHALLVLTEGRFSPKGREPEFARTIGLVKRGPYANLHWRFGVGLGIALPILLLLFAPATAAVLAAAVLALVGLGIEKDILVRAGQALSIS